MKKVATIILNRNLPAVTERLHEHLKKYDDEQTDIYVVEAGSDTEKLSRYVKWYANSEEVLRNGLRYGRGMNFGLTQLLKEGKFDQYDSFFLLTNDTEFKAEPTLAPLISILNDHPRVGILSPCSERWGERLLLKTEKTKYFWFIHNNAYLLRREFIESICDKEQPDMMNFLFDGTNFRGYGSEHELIAKAYANDWAAAITSEVWASENESHLLDHADQIKTEGYEENLKLYVTEGRRWMRKKYGFNSHWSMQQYVKGFYDKFFEFHPEYSQFKV
jgi:GT2 family glycosyltransferase